MREVTDPSFFFFAKKVLRQPAPADDEWAWAKWMFWLLASGLVSTFASHGRLVFGKSYPVTAALLFPIMHGIPRFAHGWF